MLGVLLSFTFILLSSGISILPNYKHEYIADPQMPAWGKPIHIPMRDGVVLYGQFAPAEFTIFSEPTILIRTPYPISETCVAYSLAGYNCIEQWFRGRYLSQGNYSFWATETVDAYDTIEFIKAQSWSNGIVYTMGASALGIAQYMDMIYPHPNLKSQFVIVGASDLYTTVFQGGAHRHSLIDGWLLGVGEANYSTIIYQSETNLTYWRPTTALPYCSHVTFPAVHLAGWWDIFLNPQLLAYDCYQKRGGQGGLGNSFLIVVPTGHCQHGIQSWPANAATGETVALTISTALYSAASHGGRVTTNPLVPHIAWYVMMGNLSGTAGPGNYWTAGTNFPEFQKDVWYFTSQKTLTQSGPSTDNSKLNYVYNPSNPVGTIGGCNLIIPTCGPWHQNSIETRPDVLTFTSAPFTNHYYITGPITATLFVSSNTTDTDFSVRLTDVFPNGTSLLVQDGIIRMRWRNGMTGSPQWIVPGQVYSVDVSLWNTSYVFERNHAIRVSVTSSNNPRFLPNLNNGKLINEKGNPVIALNTVFVGGSFGNSYITLPRVSAEQIPPISLSDFEKAAIGSISS